MHIAAEKQDELGQRPTQISPGKKTSRRGSARQSELAVVEKSELGAVAFCKAVWWDLRLASLLTHLLWSPYAIGQSIIFLVCDFYLLLLFFLA